MDTTITTAIIAGIVGIITGSIGSLFAPWANWGIEKRREKLKYRQELISDWRKFIRELHYHEGGDKQFGELVVIFPAWQSLRPYISQELLQEIEQYWNTMHWSVRNLEVLPKITDEIGKLEKKWKLV